MKTITLGQEVRDKITRFKGIAVAKCIYLNGCVQYLIQLLIDEKGEMPKDVWIDEQRLEIICPDHNLLSVEITADRLGIVGLNHPFKP
ncbi:hypothetical protein ES703_18799 [subsurface metagenome]